MVNAAWLDKIFMILISEKKVYIINSKVTNWNRNWGMFFQKELILSMEELPQSEDWSDLIDSVSEQKSSLALSDSVDSFSATKQNRLLFHKSLRKRILWLRRFNFFIKIAFSNWSSLFDYCMNIVYYLNK